MEACGVCKTCVTEKRPGPGCFSVTPDPGPDPGRFSVTTPDPGAGQSPLPPFF